MAGAPAHLITEVQMPDATWHDGAAARLRVSSGAKGKDRKDLEVTSMNNKFIAAPLAFILLCPLNTPATTFIDEAAASSCSFRS